MFDRRASRVSRGLLSSCQVFAGVGSILVFLKFLQNSKISNCLRGGSALLEGVWWQWCENSRGFHSKIANLVNGKILQLPKNSNFYFYVWNSEIGGPARLTGKKNVYFNWVFNFINCGNFIMHLILFNFAHCNYFWYIFLIDIFIIYIFLGGLSINSIVLLANTVFWYILRRLLLC